MTENNNPALKRAITMLRLASYGLLVFAAVWWLAVLPAIDKPATLMLDFIVWPIDDSHDSLSRDARFLSAIGAGLTAGVAIFILLVTINELEHGNPRVIRGSVIALLVWYLVDNAGSWLSGVPSNIFFNTIFLVMLLVPLWIAHRAYNKA